VVLGLVGRELSGVDEVLDVGVVVGDLGEQVVAQQGIEGGFTSPPQETGFEVANEVRA
jgi:hypothetical protein